MFLVKALQLFLGLKGGPHGASKGPTVLRLKGKSHLLFSSQTEDPRLVVGRKEGRKNDRKSTAVLRPEGDPQLFSGRKEGTRLLPLLNEGSRLF